VHKLSIVSEATGSGKTAMLLNLLGEAVLIEGTTSCSQAPVGMLSEHSLYQKTLILITGFLIGLWPMSLKHFSYNMHLFVITFSLVTFD
jgi:hypothetical protein